MRSSERGAVTALLLYLASVAPAAANPFLGSQTEALPATRAPSAAPAALISAQLAFRERAAELFQSFRDRPNPAAFAGILAAAFVYGLLHAAGPGHRKTIVFSLFLARRTAPWEPLAAGFLSAGIHAGAGIAVVAVFSLLSGAAARLTETERAGAYLEGVLFTLLVAIAAVLAIRKAAAILRGQSHAHHAGRGPVDEGDRLRENRASLYGIVAAASAVPCPGAVIMLLFALYLDLPLVGAAGVLAMSFGMGLVVSAAGYLAYFGRGGLFATLKQRGHLIGSISDVLELGSYCLVLAVSLWMAYPFLASFW